MSIDPRLCCTSELIGDHDNNRVINTMIIIAFSFSFIAITIHEFLMFMDVLGKLAYIYESFRKIKTYQLNK